MTDASFWSDDFDMDLPKIFPEAREMLGDLADVELVTAGAPCGKTGRLNHPAVWNGDHSMLAWFGFVSPSRPAFYAGADSTVRCTVWEAVRDAWPHHYLMIVERTPIWDTFALQREFDLLMYAARGWRAVDRGSLEVARARVLRSYAKGIRVLRRVVDLHGSRVRRLGAAA